MPWPLVESFMWHHLESSCRTVNLDASKIISRNFRSPRVDSTTRNILNKLPLKAYRRSRNLRDLLVRSSLPRNLPNQPSGAFPCNRTVCFSCHHVSSSTIRDALARDILASRHLFFSASRTSWFIIWLTSNVHRQVYIGETGRKLANRFREHRRDVINGRNDLPVHNCLLAY